MSTSSTLTNCYVDSIMGHEAEDVYGARFIQGPHTVTPRPSGAGDNADFSSCSFAPKSAVFPSSWSSVHPQSTAAWSGIYHPYVHHQSHLSASDSRYVRSWIDPISSHVSFSGFHSNSRQFHGTKPERLPSKSTECDSFETESRPVAGDFACGVSESTEKASTEKIEGDLSSHSEPKEEKKPQIDPSK